MKKRFTGLAIRQLSWPEQNELPLAYCDSAPAFMDGQRLISYHSTVGDDVRLQ